MNRVHLVISGRVQGVGFRYYVLRRARRLGLAGIVRNREDGSVEIEAEGELEALRALFDEVRHGPPGSRVTQVAQDWSQGPSQYRSFEIRT